MRYKSTALKGVTFPSKQYKRRLFCILKMRIWRKGRNQRWRFWSSKTSKCAQIRRYLTSLKILSQRHKESTQKPHPQKLDNTLGCSSQRDKANSLEEPGRPAAVCVLPSASTDPRQNQVTDSHIVRGDADQSTPVKEEPSQRSGEEPCVNACVAGTSDLCLSSKPLPSQGADTDISLAVPSKGIPGKMEPSQTQGGQKICKLLGPSECVSVADFMAQESDECNGGNIAKRTMPRKTVFSSDVIRKALTKDIQECLDGFYRVYGSFFPLQKRDVLTHLKRRHNINFREDLVLSEVARYRAAVAQKPVIPFRVVYKKHRLTLEDLSTLADQNWLNDQVINMYGEMIMESAQHKVYFLNSFFHRQLETKGYSGVKRWTKKVNLFSKHLLLVPIHLEDHWCLVTADMVRKSVKLYDSQGNACQEVAKARQEEHLPVFCSTSGSLRKRSICDIREYLRAEAKESKQTAFQKGWVVSVKKRIPQQTNENDCGVFVLEFCRCLVLGKPLLFSQKDILSIRKRIYKELCDCKLHK